MQGNAQQEALDADPGSMDKGPPSGQAKQFSHTIQCAHGEPAGASVVAQLFNGGGQRFSHLPSSGTK